MSKARCKVAGLSISSFLFTQFICSSLHKLLGCDCRYSGPPHKASLQRSPPPRSRGGIQPAQSGMAPPSPHQSPDLTFASPINRSVQPFSSPHRSPHRSPVRSPQDESRKLAHLVSPQSDRQNRNGSISQSPSLRSPVVASSIRSPSTFKSSDRSVCVEFD